MPRLIAVLLLSALIAATVAAPPLHAAEHAPTGAPPAVLHQEDVDDNDDTRVEVQLTVLGVALLVVVGLGVPLYFLRRRLGLVPPPPGEDAAGSSGH
jgi:hypothetical protein